MELREVENDRSQKAPNSAFAAFPESNSKPSSGRF
jgi:hypothetical protein